jgi:hypothetical protein
MCLVTPVIDSFAVDGSTHVGGTLEVVLNTRLRQNLSVEGDVHINGMVNINRSMYLK